MNLIIAGIISALIAGPAFAQEWIYLGGHPEGELETSSIIPRRHGYNLQIRLFGEHQEGTLYINQTLDVHCADKIVRIDGAWLTSDFSSRVAEMPDLPEKDRLIYIPTPNQAYNNMFDFVCSP